MGAQPVEELGQVEPEGGGCPAWSGVPLVMGPVVIVPLHITDTRSIQLDGWEHTGFWPVPGGEVEFHAYQRSAA